MNYATVCSGIGAPEQAWSGLWGPPEFTSEIEAFPSAVLRHHYPDVINHGDMTNFKEWPDHELELICGGTPCQSFSVAGLRKGMDDPRGNLTLTFLGIIALYHPRWVVWENVPGVFSSGQGTDLRAFLAGLAELGYSCAYRVLDAQFFGVPQRRRRVFVVGHLGADWRPPFAVLSEPESLRGNTPKGRKAGQEIAGDAGDGIESPSHWDGGPHPPLSQSSMQGGVGGSNQEIFSQRGAYLVPQVMVHSTGAGTWQEGAGILRAREQESHEHLVIAHGQGNAEICRDGEPSLTCNHEAPIAFCQNQGGDVLVNEKMHSLATNPNATGRNSPCVAINARQDPIVTEKAQPLDQKGNSQAVCFAENSRSEVRLEGGDGERTGALNTGGGNPGQGLPCVDLHPHAIGRKDEAGPQAKPYRTDGKAYTHDSRGVSQAVATDSIVRRLTPMECERLQGFPDDYTLIPWKKAMATDGHRYKALGNSMAVPVLKWIGERIQMWEDINGRT